MPEACQDVKSTGQGQPSSPSGPPTQPPTLTHPEPPAAAGTPSNARITPHTHHPDDIEVLSLHPSTTHSTLSIHSLAPTASRSSRASSRAPGVERTKSHHTNAGEETAADDDLRRASTHRSRLQTAGPSTIPDEFYDRIAPRKKMVIVATLSFCAFLAPMASTAVLSAIPEVSAELETTPAVIGVSNAVFMIGMGISPVVWGPMSQVYGRRISNIAGAFLFFVASIGTAFSPNIGSYFFFRLLTALMGTGFLLVGAACLGDIYRPTERATAMGWFFSGTLIGPALGPFIGGVIVTYSSWRAIFYLQSALAGTATLLCVLLLPETSPHRRIEELQQLPKRRDRAIALAKLMDPTIVVRLFRYPNLFLVAMSSAALVWNMYSLLTPIRYVLNPRFGLSTPLQAGLFYLAPGAGYMVGTFGGGRFADAVVKRYIKKKNGRRVPEDRLRAAVPFGGVVIPACMLVYGWGVDKAVGGIPLVVIAMFLQGVAQLFCFPALNTYCLDVMQGRGAEVIAGNYMVRYMFACLGTAVVLPAVEAIGVGWFSTISALFVVVTTVGVVATVKYGERMQDWSDDRKAKSEKKKGVVDEESGVSQSEVEEKQMPKGREDEKV